MRRASTSAPAGFFRDHFAVLLALLASMLVALRLLTIANLNPVTAMAILQNLGFANVLIGTLIGAFSTIVACGLVAALALLVHGPRRHRSLSLVLVAVLAVLAFMTVYWFLLVLILGAISASEVSNRLRARRGGGEPKERSALGQRVATVRGLTGTLVTVSVASLLPFGFQPWIAPENVRAADGHGYVAYVLRNDGDGAALMLYESRRVIYLVEPLGERNICQGPVSVIDGRSLYELLTLPRRYPACRAEADQR